MRGRVLEARVAVSRSQLVFGTLPTHSTADENLVLENLCPQLPARFRIPAHSAYHCQPSEGGPKRGHLSLREQKQCTCTSGRHPAGLPQLHQPEFGCLCRPSRDLVQVTKCCLPLHAASKSVLRAQSLRAPPLLHCSLLEPGTSAHPMRHLQDVTLLLPVPAGQQKPCIPPESRLYTPLALVAGMMGPLPPV